MCFRDRIQRQDQDNLLNLMQSIIIGKILKLAAFIKPHGIHIHRLGGKKSFLLKKKTDPTFFTPSLFFIKYSKNNTPKAYFQLKQIIGL